MNSRSSPLGGSVKIPTRVAMPLFTRSAASSAPAPPESSETTMMSAGVTGSLTTSAHPAARRNGSQKEGIATIAVAANAPISSIERHRAFPWLGLISDLLRVLLTDFWPFERHVQSSVAGVE